MSASPPPTLGRLFLVPAPLDFGCTTQTPLQDVLPMGTLTVAAVGARDYPVLQGIFLLLSISVVAANLVADIVYGRLDPRVRA